jgi:hypothetical protein
MTSSVGSKPLSINRRSIKWATATTPPRIVWHTATADEYTDHPLRHLTPANLQCVSQHLSALQTVTVLQSRLFPVIRSIGSLLRLLVELRINCSRVPSTFNKFEYTIL